MDVSGLPRVIPRPAPEGTIPLVAVEGTAYDCGREYAEICMSRYPGFRQYFDRAWQWKDMPLESRALIEKHCPHMFDLFRGVYEVAGPPQAKASRSSNSGPVKPGCTGFGIHPSATLDGHAIIGQTKDTPHDRVPRYLVFRARITGAPTILVLAYPGEVMGYGMWSPGLVHTRHSMYAKAGAGRGPAGFGLTYAVMSCARVGDAVELIKKYSGHSPGGHLIGDASGDCYAVDICAGGVGFLAQKHGIVTRANHPVAPECKPFAEYPCKAAEEDSEYRTHGLWKLLDAEHGRLTPQKVQMILADHTMYPRGVCKHYNEDANGTTAVIICEPSLGRAHVIRGQPCCNWAVTYTI